MANLSALERTIAKYDAQAPNIQQDIKNKINAQFDNGKPWLEDTARWERDILPAFYKQFAEQGTGASDLSPAQQLLQGSQNTARSGRLADVGSGIYARQQDRESEMLRNRLAAWQMARQTATDAWSREMQRQAAARASRTPTNPWDNFDFTGDDTADTSTGASVSLPKLSAGAPAVRSTQNQLIGAIPDVIKSFLPNFLKIFKR